MIGRRPRPSERRDSPFATLSAPLPAPPTPRPLSRLLPSRLFLGPLSPPVPAASPLSSWAGTAVRLCKVCESLHNPSIQLNVLSEPSRGCCRRRRSPCRGRPCSQRPSDPWLAVCTCYGVTSSSSSSLSSGAAATSPLPASSAWGLQRHGIDPEPLLSISPPALAQFPPFKLSLFLAPRRFRDLFVSLLFPLIYFPSLGQGVAGAGGFILGKGLSAPTPVYPPPFSAVT